MAEEKDKDNFYEETKSIVENITYFRKFIDQMKVRGENDLSEECKEMLGIMKGEMKDFLKIPSEEEIKKDKIKDKIKMPKLSGTESEDFESLKSQIDSTEDSSSGGSRRYKKKARKPLQSDSTDYEEKVKKRRKKRKPKPKRNSSTSSSDNSKLGFKKLVRKLDNRTVPAFNKYNTVNQEEKI